MSLAETLRKERRMPVVELHNYLLRNGSHVCSTHIFGETKNLDRKIAELQKKIPPKNYNTLNFYPCESAATILQLKDKVLHRLRHDSRVVFVVNNLKDVRGDLGLQENVSFTDWDSLDTLLNSNQLKHLFEQGPEQRRKIMNIPSHAKKPSKWQLLANKIADDPVHLAGYSKQLKQDIREFRDNFEFKHDLG